MTRTRRWLALGGIAGPVAFVAAWSMLGTGRSGYSPVHDPISELAAVDASSRAAMTAGFIAFGLGVGAYAWALHAALPGGAGPAAAVAAVASFGVAAFPLGADVGDDPHAAAAFVAYGALAVMPVLAAPRLRRGYGSLSIASGAVVGAALLTSVVASQGVGLAQRIGLTVADVWIVVTAVAIFRGGPSGCSDTAAEPRRRP